LADARRPHDGFVGQSQGEAADRQIDRLVYNLYGLMEKEIKLVEEATPQ